jgi:hypothetical protein
MAISHHSAEDRIVNRVRHALKGFESLDDGVKKYSHLAGSMNLSSSG